MMCDLAAIRRRGSHDTGDMEMNHSRPPSRNQESRPPSRNQETRPPSRNQEVKQGESLERYAVICNHELVYLEITSIIYYNDLLELLLDCLFI